MSLEPGVDSNVKPLHERRLNQRRSGTPRRSKSCAETEVSEMAPNENSKNGSSRKSARERNINTNNNKSLELSGGGTSPRKSAVTPRKRPEAKSILGREKMPSGQISINVTACEDEETKDEVKGLDVELVSILKVPGRSRERSKSLPPSMIMEQMAEGARLLGPNSALKGLANSASAIEEESRGHMSPPPTSYPTRRRVSFSIPLVELENDSGGVGNPQSLLPPVGDNSRSSSSDSLDSDTSSKARPSSPIIQRGMLPSGSSIFQKAMLEDSSEDDENQELDSVFLPNHETRLENAPRSRTAKNKNTTNSKMGVFRYSSPTSGNYLSPRRAHSNSLSPLPPRKALTGRLSPRRNLYGSISPGRSPLRSPRQLSQS